MPRGIPKSGQRMTKNRLAAIAVKPVAPIKQETDAQIRMKLSERFTALDKMSESTILGNIKSLIVSGPAGLGKSYGVMKIAAKYENSGHQVTCIKGFVRPTGLYKTLYENRHPNCVLIFDDADSIFNDDISLNLLKGACDMTRTRHLHWLAETRMEDEDGERLPTSFNFEGSIIFITNYDFDSFIAKGTRLAPHFEAMISRSIYLDLAMKTKRDYMIRIHQIAPAMMAELGLTEKDGEEIVAFIDKNHEKLRELSLRMVLKIANLRRMDRSGWETDARVTCFKPS